MLKLPSLKFLAFLLLLLLSGCGRADISDERKNYILANEHAWVELSVDIAPQSIEQTSSNCILEVTVNGERFLSEPLFPSGAIEKSIKTGFLFAAPAAKSEVTLNYSQCQKQPKVAAVSLDLPVDTLAKLKFDGTSISATAPVAYKPVTLSEVSNNLGRIESAQQENQATVAGQLSQLSKLVIALLILVGAGLILVVLKHGKKQA
jgi:hypothetical protein